MSQKFVKIKNNNKNNAKTYGNHFVGTDEIADFIQSQASVKKSDIKAVLQELGEAMKHFFEMGQKIKLEGIGILKVGFSSIGVEKPEDCTVSTITTRRVLFQPETERVVVGQQKTRSGAIRQKYVNAINLLKDVAFEETHDNAMNPSTPSSTGGNTSGSGNTSGGGNTSGSGNTGGGGDDSGMDQN